MLKLHNIYSSLPVSIKRSETQSTRREQTVYDCLSLSELVMQYLTHSYFLKDEDHPVIAC